MQLSAIEQAKLALLRKQFGSMDSTTALARAIEFEETKRACGPFDPYYEHAAKEQQALEQYACLLERNGE